MSQTDGTLLRDNRCSHRRGQIIDHNHHIDRMIVEEGVELSHHPAGDLVETHGVDTEKELRTRHLEIVEERGFERGIILTARIDEQALSLSRAADGPDERRHFHKVRSCTCKYTNFLSHKAF